MHAYFPTVNISTVLHECAIAPSAPGKAYTIPTSITKYKIDGTSAPGGPEDFGNQTIKFLDSGYIVYTPNRTNCPLTLEFQSIVNTSSGAAYAATAGQTNYFLNLTGLEITFFNYTTSLETPLTLARFYVYIKSPYVNTFVSIMTTSAGAHVCN